MIIISLFLIASALFFIAAALNEKQDNTNHKLLEMISFIILGVSNGIIVLKISASIFA